MPLISPRLLYVGFCALLFSFSARAEEIQALNRGDQSVAAFYTSITNAKHSIAMATFLFEPCESVPKILLDAMVKKAKQGVQVRLVIDAYNMSDSRKAVLAAYLKNVPNFKLRFYNDSWTFITENMRSHIKALVIDGKTVDRLHIVGGRNITDGYFGLSAKMNYLDQDLLIRGASAAEAQKAYDMLWKFSGKPTAKGNVKAFVEKCLKPNARDKQVTAYLKANSSALLDSRPVHSCRNVLYAADRPDFMQTDHFREVPRGGKKDRLERKRATQYFLEFLKGTRFSIAMINQYYLPWVRVSKALHDLREREVKVDIFTSATSDIADPSHNRSFTCYIRAAAMKAFKAGRGVRLITSAGSLQDRWELSPAGAEWRIHTKSGIRDGRDSWVSSFNIDPRSYNINLESGVVVEDCSELAEDLSAQYKQLHQVAEADEDCEECQAELATPTRNAIRSCGGFPSFY